MRPACRWTRPTSSTRVSPSGSAYTIYQIDVTGATGYNSTYKGFYWPRFIARYIGDQTKRGGGGILGTNWSKDVVGTATENGYMGSYVYDGTLSPGKLWCGYGSQTVKTWETPSPRTATACRCGAARATTPIPTTRRHQAGPMCQVM